MEQKMNRPEFFTRSFACVECFDPFSAQFTIDNDASLQMNKSSL
jgi:hypothetical protein